MAETLENSRRSRGGSGANEQENDSYQRAEYNEIPGEPTSPYSIPMQPAASWGTVSNGTSDGTPLYVVGDRGFKETFARVQSVCYSIVHSRPVQYFVIVAILVNAATLGFETSEYFEEHVGTLLWVVNLLCLLVFAIELLLKFIGEGRDFFKSGWNWFDMIVLSFSFFPDSGVWSAFYALRVLRVLRVLSVAPALQLVAAAFIASIPASLAVFAVLFLDFYISGILATHFFGSMFPAWFGSLGSSMYSLFQIMTLESWSMGISRPTMSVYPYAWAFFMPFIMISTWTMLNLFIGIIVNTISEVQKQRKELERKESEKQSQKERQRREKLGLPIEDEAAPLL